MRTGFNIVAQRTQVFDAGPDRCPAESKLMRQFSAGNRAITGRSQRIEDFGVDGHDYISKSRPISTARAEWVSAPTDIKSTPVSAIARTVSKRTPPLASVCARPFTFTAAR